MNNNYESSGREKENARSTLRNLLDLARPDSIDAALLPLLDFLNVLRGARDRLPDAYTSLYNNDSGSVTLKRQCLNSELTVIIPELPRDTLLNSAIDTHPEPEPVTVLTIRANQHYVTKLPKNESDSLVFRLSRTGYDWQLGLGMGDKERGLTEEVITALRELLLTKCKPYSRSKSE